MFVRLRVYASCHLSLGGIMARRPRAARPRGKSFARNFPSSVQRGRADRDGRRGVICTSCTLDNLSEASVGRRPAARSRALDAHGEAPVLGAPRRPKPSRAAICGQWHHLGRAEPYLRRKVCLGVHSHRAPSIGGLCAHPNPDQLCARCPCAAVAAALEIGSCRERMQAELESADDGRPRQPREFHTHLVLVGRLALAAAPNGPEESK